MLPALPCSVNLPVCARTIRPSTASELTMWLGNRGIRRGDLRNQVSGQPVSIVKLSEGKHGWSWRRPNLLIWRANGRNLRVAGLEPIELVLHSIGPFGGEPGLDPTGTLLQMARTLYLHSCSQRRKGEYVLWDRTCKRNYVTLKSGRCSARKRWIHHQVELGRFTAEQLTEENAGERQEPAVTSG